MLVVGRKSVVKVKPHLKGKDVVHCIWFRVQLHQYTNDLIHAGASHDQS